MPEEKKKEEKPKRKESALKRFIMRRTGADKVVGGMQGKTPEQVEAERKKQDEARRKKK